MAQAAHIIESNVLEIDFFNGFMQAMEEQWYSAFSFIFTVETKKFSRKEPSYFVQLPIWKTSEMNVLQIKATGQRI